jgi:hypothetical protein
METNEKVIRFRELQLAVGGICSEKQIKKVLGFRL